MIPKKIHYCWFGGKPLPKEARKCIASWRRFFPDYEIIEWNESNFDVNSIPYTREAYSVGKYAFVSDYARFKILYEHGGLYFDTDVEVIRPFDDIVAAGPFMGFEKCSGSDFESDCSGVNPGLGLAAFPGMKIYSEILDFYSNKEYIIGEGTVVTYTTSILRKNGLENNNVKQTIANITIFPTDVLCPIDSTTGITRVTPDTVSIHHYSCSWINHRSLSYQLHLLKNTLIRVFGEKRIMKICAILKGTK